MKKFFSRVYIKLRRLLSGGGLSRIGIFKKINYYLNLYFIQGHPEFLKIHGNAIFYIDPLDTLNFSLDEYEPFSCELFKKYLHKGDVFVDIGANMGFFTILAAQLIGEKGRVFAFEPEPNNFALLKKNVEANNLTNVEIFKKAVAEKNGETFLHLTDFNLGGHSLFNVYSNPEKYIYPHIINKKDDWDTKKIIVETTTLDEFFKYKSVKPNFIKIDIEGAEGLAQKGMINCLRHPLLKVIIVEIHPTIMVELNINPQQFLEEFLNLGFAIYNIQQYKKRLEPLSISQILEKYSVQNNKSTNLFIIRE